MSSRRRRRPPWRDPSLLTMAGLMAALTGLAFLLKGAGGVTDGFAGAGRLLANAAPELLLGIALAGMLQVLMPPGMVGRWMGDDAGLLGLAVGMAVGALTPGGPYVMFPVAAALMNSGAGVGPLAGFVATRNLITVNRLLVWEIPFLGAPFSFARLITSLVMPPLTAVLVPIVYRLIPGGAGKAPAAGAPPGGPGYTEPGERDAP